MNRFVHRMLGHYLMDEAEEGADLGAVAEAQEEEQPEEGAEQPEAEEEELVISLGDQPEEEGREEVADTPAIREMRKRIKEQNRELRELKAKEAQRAQAEAPKAPEVGPKPTLEDCDYDAEDFEQKLTAWHERKRQAEAFAEEQRKTEEKQKEEWQAKLNGYAEQKAQIPVADYEEIEAMAADTLSQTQQAIIISGADKPAHLIYAIGKNPAKLKELAGITDPVKFAFAVAKLETQMKVENRPKAKPAPERVVSGSAPASNSDAHLERLRTEAEKTGDYSKVTAYKKQLREKQRA